MVERSLLSILSAQRIIAREHLFCFCLAGARLFVLTLINGLSEDAALSGAECWSLPLAANNPRRDTFFLLGLFSFASRGRIREEGQLLYFLAGYQLCSTSKKGIPQLSAPMSMAIMLKPSVSMRRR